MFFSQSKFKAKEIGHPKCRDDEVYKSQLLYRMQDALSQGHKEPHITS